MNKHPDTNYNRFEEIDREDLEDILMQIEHSFKIKFDHDDFLKVTTYGEMCDVIFSKVELANNNGCTRQQAFYKLRMAIADTFSIDSGIIKSDTLIENIVPRKNRIRMIKELKRNLGINLKILSPPLWFIIADIVLFLLGLCAFFFSWKIAVVIIVISVLGFIIGDVFGKEIDFETVRDLVKEMIHKHYLKSRRDKLTVNKEEMQQILDDILIETFYLERSSLVRDVKFGWIK
ncbi:hypothetical protein HQN86_19310 [Pedobacter panaciterrae]|uniref:hypothetical protein n=1 Tax=Pedobacter panaciterrae TaxID=363849 RepID=UPI00155DAD04|nr:hypothetical protein [Pedobacter panaciterrae]NQX55779.1 hypothetical protein [Pedobacter panaciterrae]